MTATVLRLLLDGSQRQTPKLARILTPADLQERGIRHEFTVGPAMFGPELGVGEFQVGGELVEMKPIGGVLDNGCSEYDPQEARDIMGKILLINRGGCLFVLKVHSVVPYTITMWSLLMVMLRYLNVSLKVPVI